MFDFKDNFDLGGKYSTVSFCVRILDSDVKMKRVHREILLMRATPSGEIRNLAVELWRGFSTSVLSCCQHGFTNFRKSTSGTSADLQDTMMMMMFVSADVNDCAGQPCENGGTCRDLDGDFKCHCPSPYVGKHCQLRKSDQSHHWTIIRTTLRLQQLLCSQVLTND